MIALVRAVAACATLVAAAAAAAAVDMTSVVVAVSEDAAWSIAEQLLVPELQRRTGASVKLLPASGLLADAAALPQQLVLVDMHIEKHFEWMDVAVSGHNVTCLTGQLDVVAAHVEAGAVFTVPLASDAAAAVLALAGVPHAHVLKRSAADAASTLVVVSGRTRGGVRAAVARMLLAVSTPRADRSADGTIPSELDASTCVLHAPPPYFHTRGQMLTDWGFSFPSWDAATTYLRELIVFGTNMIEFAHIVRRYAARAGRAYRVLMTDCVACISYARLCRCADVVAWRPEQPRHVL
jgi:hypothetical protein